MCAQDTNHTKEVRLYHDNNHKTSSMTACGRMQCVSPTTCATLADHKNRREKIFKAPLTGPLLSGEALLGPAQQITHVRPPPPHSDNNDTPRQYNDRTTTTILLHSRRCNNTQQRTAVAESKSKFILQTPHLSQASAQSVPECLPSHSLRLLQQQLGQGR